VHADLALYAVGPALWFCPHAARISSGFGRNSLSLHRYGGTREENLLSKSPFLSLTGIAGGNFHL
jgi:hypothetical protein